MTQSSLTRGASGGSHGAPAFWENSLISARDKLSGLAQGTKSGSQPTSARDLYSTLPQNEGDYYGQSQSRTARQRPFVDSALCNAFIALVISANTIVIALECQYMNDPKAQAFYGSLEFLFCIIYMAEISVRCCAHGIRGFFCAVDNTEWGWNLFDFVTTVVGMVGVVGSDMLNVHLNASVLRLLRVLRIVRVFRILKFMKDIEYTLVSAMWSMLRIMFLVLMIDFIGAVVITHLLADTPDEIISEMFGDLTASMYHLFIVMVDGMGAMHTLQHTDEAGEFGMIIITQKVIQVHPHMSFFWIAFVFIGSISLMALVPAIFVELNLRDAEVARKRQMKEEWEHRVEAQRAALELVFQAADKDKSHSLTRAEMEEFLEEKDVLKRLGLDVDSDEDDDEMSQEKLDIRQLRMEFSMVYDAIEAEGRMELSCAEFIEAFRHMRAKPMDQVVLTLQQEIFKLRSLMQSENQKILNEVRRLARLADKVDAEGGSIYASGGQHLAAATHTMEGHRAAPAHAGVSASASGSTSALRNAAAVLATAGRGHAAAAGKPPATRHRGQGAKAHSVPDMSAGGGVSQTPFGR